MRLFLDDPKQWPPRDYWSYSWANLGRPLDFSQINSWAIGHLIWAGWVHHSWRFGHAEALCEVGPEMPQCRSKTTTVPVIWATFGIFLAQSKWFPVMIRDHERNLVITMTQRQSNNQWSGGIAAHSIPKNSECRYPLVKFSPQYFGSRQHPPHWLSSKGPNYQRRILLISAGETEGHFEGKTQWQGHLGGLVLAWQCPDSPGTCNPEETGLPGLQMSWTPTLFSISGPVGLPPVPWTEKKTIERSPFFVWCRDHCCHGNLVGWTTFWIFFAWLTKVRATG